MHNSGGGPAHETDKERALAKRLGELERRLAEVDPPGGAGAGQAPLRKPTDGQSAEAVELGKAVTALEAGLPGARAVAALPGMAHVLPDLLERIAAARRLWHEQWEPHRHLHLAQREVEREKERQVKATARCDKAKAALAEAMAEDAAAKAALAAHDAKLVELEGALRTAQEAEAAETAKEAAATVAAAVPAPAADGGAKRGAASVDAPVRNAGGSGTSDTTTTAEEAQQISASLVNMSGDRLAQFLLANPLLAQGLAAATTQNVEGTLGDGAAPPSKKANHGDQGSTTDVEMLEQRQTAAAGVTVPAA